MPEHFSLTNARCFLQPSNSACVTLLDLLTFHNITDKNAQEDGRVPPAQAHPGARGEALLGARFPLRPLPAQALTRQQGPAASSAAL